MENSAEDRYEPEHQGEEPEQQGKKKKKRGCFTYLWILFSLLLFLSAIATAVFYLRPHTVTGWALQIYTQRIAAVLTGPEYYQIAHDSEYSEGVKGKEKSAGFSSAELKKKILAARYDEARNTFQELVDTYKKFPEQDWQPSLQKLNDRLKQIFHDQKVTQIELREFLGEVKKTTKAHLKKAPQETPAAPIEDKPKQNE